MNGVIYIHSNKVNGKVYVGQSRNLKNRWSSRYSSQTYFSNAIKKWGWDGFDHQIVVDGIQTQKELDRFEKLWISVLRATDRNLGYNLTLGGATGTLGWIPSDKTRRKWGEQRKGNKNCAGRKQSEKAKSALLKANFGRPAWNKGLSTGKLSLEHREKIRLSLIGKPSRNSGLKNLVRDKTGRLKSAIPISSSTALP